MTKSSLLDKLVAAGLALSVWQLIVWLTDAPHFILPGPWRVAQSFLFNIELIAENAVTTITEVLIGLLLGTLLGAATAIQITASPLTRRLLLPVLVFTQAVPVFALAPVFTLWLGYGLASKIVMTVLIIYFPVTSAFHDGLSRTSPGMLDLAHCMGASPNRIMWKIKIPHALPSLGTGLRLASVYAPIGAVLGEWVGASKGLGFLMLLANGRAKIDLMFAALFVLAVFTIALHASINKLARRLEDYAEGRGP